MLSFFELYYVQFKEVKLQGGQGPGMRLGGLDQGLDNPNTRK